MQAARWRVWTNKTARRCPCASAGMRAAECVAHEGLRLPLPPREDRASFALDVVTAPAPVQVKSFWTKGHADRLGHDGKAKVEMVRGPGSALRATTKLAFGMERETEHTEDRSEAEGVLAAHWERKKQTDHGREESSANEGYAGPQNSKPDDGHGEPHLDPASTVAAARDVRQRAQSDCCRFLRPPSSVLRPTPAACSCPAESDSNRLLNKCPFTGFPLPAVPEPLRGFYLTDNSDAGLTDMEGPTDDSFFLSPSGGGSAASKQRASVELREECFLEACLEYIRTGGESEEGKKAGDKGVRVAQETGVQVDVDEQGKLVRTQKRSEQAEEEEKERKLHEKAGEWTTECIEKKVDTLRRSRAGREQAEGGEKEGRSRQETPRTGEKRRDQGEEAFALSLPFPSQRLFYRTFLYDLPLSPTEGDHDPTWYGSPAQAVPLENGASGGLCTFLRAVLTEPTRGAGDCPHCGQAQAVGSLRDESRREADGLRLTRTGGQTTVEGHMTKQTKRGRKKQTESGITAAGAVPRKEAVSCRCRGAMRTSEDGETRSRWVEESSSGSACFSNRSRDTGKTMSPPSGRKHTGLESFLASLAQKDHFLRVRVLEPLLEAAQAFSLCGQQSSSCEALEEPRNPQVVGGSAVQGSRQEEIATKLTSPCHEFRADAEAVLAGTVADSNNEEGKRTLENRGGDTACLEGPEGTLNLTRLQGSAAALGRRAPCRDGDQTGHVEEATDRLLDVSAITEGCLTGVELLCRVYQKASDVLRRHARAAAFLPFLSPVGLAAFLADALPTVKIACPAVSSHVVSPSRCSFAATGPARRHRYRGLRLSRRSPPVPLTSVLPGRGGRTNAKNRGSASRKKKGLWTTAASFRRLCRELERSLLRQLARSAYPSSDHSGEAALADLLRAAGADEKVRKTGGQRRTVGASIRAGRAEKVHRRRQQLRHYSFEKETTDRYEAKAKNNTSLRRFMKGKRCAGRAHERSASVTKALEAKYSRPPVTEQGKKTVHDALGARRPLPAGSLAERRATSTAKKKTVSEEDVETTVGLSTTEDSGGESGAGYHERLCWMCGVGGDLILCDGHALCPRQAAAQMPVGSEIADGPEKVPSCLDNPHDVQGEGKVSAVLSEPEREEPLDRVKTRESSSPSISPRSASVLAPPSSRSPVGGRTPSSQLAKRCRRVYHLGCIYPPPTDRELQPTATWRCPVCVEAGRKRHRRSQKRGVSSRSLDIGTCGRATCRKPAVPGKETVCPATGAGGRDSCQHVTQLEKVEKGGPDDSTREWRKVTSEWGNTKRERVDNVTGARVLGREDPTAVGQQIGERENAHLVGSVDNPDQAEAEENTHRPAQTDKATGKERNGRRNCTRSGSASGHLGTAEVRFGTKSSLSLHLISLKKIFVEEVKVFLASTRRVRRRYEWLVYQRQRRETKLKRLERQKGKRAERDVADSRKQGKEDCGREADEGKSDEQGQTEAERSGCRAREGDGRGDQALSQGCVSGKGRRLIGELGGERTRRGRARAEVGKETTEEGISRARSQANEEGTRDGACNTGTTTRRYSAVEWSSERSGELLEGCLRVSVGAARKKHSARGVLGEGRAAEELYAEKTSFQEGAEERSPPRSEGVDGGTHRGRKSSGAGSESRRGTKTEECDQDARSCGRGKAQLGSNERLRRESRKEGERVGDRPGKGRSSAECHVLSGTSGGADDSMSNTGFGEGKEEQDENTSVSSSRELGEGELDMEQKDESEVGSLSTERRHHSRCPPPVRTMLTRASAAAAAVPGASAFQSGSLSASEGEEETDPSAEDLEDSFFGRTGQTVDPFVAAGRDRRFSTALRVLTKFHEHTSAPAPLIRGAQQRGSNLTFARVAWHLQTGCCKDCRPGLSPESTTNLPRSRLESAGKGTGGSRYAASSLGDQGRLLSGTAARGRDEPGTRCLEKSWQRATIGSNDGARQCSEEGEGAEESEQQRPSSGRAAQTSLEAKRQQGGQHDAILAFEDVTSPLGRNATGADESLVFLEKGKTSGTEKSPRERLATGRVTEKERCRDCFCFREWAEGSEEVILKRKAEGEVDGEVSCHCEDTARRVAAEAVADLAVVDGSCFIRPFEAEIATAIGPHAEDVESRSEDTNRAAESSGWSPEERAPSTPGLRTPRKRAPQGNGSVGSALPGDAAAATPGIWLQFLASFCGLNLMALPATGFAAPATKPVAVHSCAEESLITGGAALAPCGPARTPPSDEVSIASPVRACSRALFSLQRSTPDAAEAPVLRDSSRAPGGSFQNRLSSPLSAEVLLTHYTFRRPGKNPQSGHIGRRPRLATTPVRGEAAVLQEGLSFPVSSVSPPPAPTSPLLASCSPGTLRDALPPLGVVTASASTALARIHSRHSVAPIEGLQVSSAAHPPAANQFTTTALTMVQSFHPPGREKVPCFSRGPRKAAAKATIVFKHMDRTAEVTTRGTSQSAELSRAAGVTTRL